MNKNKIKIGDRIKFKSPTRNGSFSTWRKVNGFWGNTNMPTVRFEGWSNFAVKIHEIIDIEKGAK
jgi:hypothetical protein